ncbi:MAG: ATP-binding protein [Lachnospiraceae bacterium]|nr:ATP-binding protein [Lachnospiraceae bacterium]
MKRNAVNELIEWKEQKCPVPFLLAGTKGVGKTYLAIEFALAYYPQYLYVNFELNAVAEQFFCDKILSGLSVSETIAQYFGLDETILSELIVILDEVSFCPPLFKSLAHCGSFPIIAISGLLPPPKMLEHFHVCRLFPLRFDEFLCAVGNDWYVDIIQGHFLASKPVPDIVHQELLALFEEYLVVGGMPAAVNEYISSKSVYNVGEVHCMIKNRMRAVMDAVYDEKETGKAVQIMEVLPEQLKRENKKFRFNLIRKGVTYALYRDSLLALERSGMILRLNKQEKDTHFKLYLPDVGMLSSAFAGEETDEIRKALLENYVMQTLLAGENYRLSFWESKAQAKVDFILEKDGYETPVELRLSKGGRGKSIASYRAAKNCREETLYYCFGFENFYSTSVSRQIPYYAVFCLE